MCNILQFIFHFTVTIIRLMLPGGHKKIAAENIALRQQLITLARKHKRSPKLTASDRAIFGLLAHFISSKRLAKIAITIKPATILKFHKALVKRKYSRLFSSKPTKKPGPAGPYKELIQLIIEMKKRNPRFGTRRIAMQINNMFGLNINKDTVRHVLNKYYFSKPGGDSPSWLTFIGHMKDSLWSIDFFRVESIHLKSHWVMVVMDQFTRRIIGFAVNKGELNGIIICRMFNAIISRKLLPKYLSSDNDPLFTFHRWQSNLRVLDIKEIKSIPFTPTSHPFVERVIRTVRNELLDHTLFFSELDLQRKLDDFQHYFNEHRTHLGIDGAIPNEIDNKTKNNVIDINQYRWKSHCNGLFQLPIAA